MQDLIWQTKQPHNCIEEQHCNLLSKKLPFTPAASYNPNNPKQPFNANHDCILPLTQGHVGHEINGPSAKMPGKWREWLQETIRQLRIVFGMLAHLISATFLLADLPHVRPPDTCSQKSIHPLSPKVSCHITAVGLVQQHLLTHPRHHNPCSFSWPLNTSSSTCLDPTWNCARLSCALKFPHFCIRGLPGSFVELC